MANGDEATAAGMDVVDGFTADHRLGYDEINKTRDYIAAATPLSHRQIDGVNSVARTVIQSGTGRIAGVAATSITVPITFPVPFASFPDVTFDAAGLEAKGAFDPATGAQTGLYSYHHSTSATGFTGTIGKETAMNPTFDYYYTWIAIGVLA